MSPLAWSNSPITVLGGELKSFTADPSRKNSGLWQTPKSAPAFFPENSSRMGITILCMVPGKMVLRIATVCRASLFLSACPICSQMRLIYLRSRFPLAWLGVPTQTKESSVSLMALGLVVGGAQPTRTNIRCNDLIELRFDNRRSAVVYQFNLFLNRVNTDDFLAVICETSRRHRTGVAQSKNADIQHEFLSLLIEYKYKPIEPGSGSTSRGKRPGA